MDNLLQLLTLANFVFALIIWALVWVQRKMVTFFWKGAESNKYWRELLLPLGPLFTGGLLGLLVTNYPYPEDFSSGPARVFFGVVCGLLSAHLYKMVKGFVKKKLEEANDGQGPDLLPELTDKSEK